MALSPNPQPPTYEQFQAAIPPGWLRNPYGAAYDGALGEQKDFELSKIKQGILARYANTAPLDALPLIAADRGVPQGPNEPLEHYLPRLINAWGAWQIAGTAWGILSQLNAAGYGSAYVVQTNGVIYGPSGGTVTHAGTGSGVVSVAGITQTAINFVLKITTGSSPSNNGQFSFSFDGGTTYTVPQAVPEGSSPDGGLVYLTGTALGTNGQQINAGGIAVTFYGANNSTFVFTLGDTYTVTNSAIAPDPVNGLPGQPPNLQQPNFYDLLGDGGFVYPQYVIGSGSGQADPGYPSTPSVPYPGGWNVGPSAITELFWNRYYVIIDPPPATWTNIVNPPAADVAAAPSQNEINFLAEVITGFGAGHAVCLGIMVRDARAAFEMVDPRSSWGWPITTVSTGGFTFPCWFAREGSGFDGFVSFSQPNSMHTWLPHQTFTIANSEYYFMSPSRGNASNKPLAWYYTQANGSHTTGFTEPTWPGSGTVVDNGITWTYGGTLNEWGLTVRVTTFTVT